MVRCFQYPHSTSHYSIEHPSEPLYSLPLTNSDMNPEERLRLAERLLREAEELRDRCARTGDLMACVQAGEKAWGALFQALRAIKPDLRSGEVFDFVDHELPSMPGVPEDVVSALDRAAEGALTLHSYCFYGARVKVCLRRDRYERIREAIRAIRRWLRRTKAP